MEIPNIPPFSINDLPFQEAPFNTEHSPDFSGEANESCGYYVRSTAQLHVEDEPVDFSHSLERENSDYASQLRKIAKDACATKNLVIAIHGYSVSEFDAKTWYTQIYNFVRGNTPPKEQTTEETSLSTNIANPLLVEEATVHPVFIGYRWPAEKRTEHSLQKIQYAFEALPPLLLGIFLSTFAVGSITFSLLTQSLVTFCLLSIGVLAGIIFVILFSSQPFNAGFSFIAGGMIVAAGTALYYFNSTQSWYLGLLTVLTASSVFLGSLVMTLILIRIVSYSRDRYRASNYGTTDLVELIRQLDQTIFELQGSPPDPLNDIELSFIGHSLGCDVLTHAVRILSLCVLISSNHRCGALRNLMCFVTRLT